MKDTHAERFYRELEELDDRGAKMNELLRHAVNWLHDQSPDHDWTGVYELHPDNTLRLGPFVGEPSEHVVITVGHGVCGTAVARNCNMNIPDVSKAPNYLACSAATKSELVVLIRHEGHIYAQIDIDSHRLNAFGEGQVDEVQRLAHWLAAAYQSRTREPVGA